ncbi:hypothetical protein DAPPUDRAFT_264788 [Daphnia pulex]|uniref:Uncharacterized protein n=1 Tax=Daphnia pulex TaxID=6669 RepID=E9HSC0_DAPPU|nr:hypothetical protein DAPPUDRAFT_264788 [Daphnia pulex]|eukprot:EFX65363.1 hypothetical protein DAPPUDRAFT_264788 [Daphnia pulex]
MVAAALELAHYLASTIEQQNPPSSSTEEPKSSSRTVREYSLEGGKEDLKTGSSVNNSPGGRELPADRQKWS